ncbi:MAG: DUF362 domain-containing protein [Promethearchaeati archaeon]
MNQETRLKPRVAIVRSESPEKALSEGLEKLGGISEFIQEGDIIFIKISLRSTSGFPSHSNLNLVKKLISLCKDANPKKIYVGSFLTERITIKFVDEIFELKAYFKALGAEFVFLDNSDLYNEKINESSNLKDLKSQNQEKININNSIIEIPKILLKSDKFINLNQVNVSPINQCTLSLDNQFSILPKKYREIHYTEENKKDIVKNDKYQEELSKRIIDAYLIKKPILTINDLFYILEGAGPYIYKDSNLKTSNFLIVGTDSIAVDTITLMLMNLNTSNNKIIVEAVNRGVGPKLLSDIEIIGETLQDSTFEINLCKTKLSNIRIQNIHPFTGSMCSGCFLKAYHLLNIFKSYLVKDLKYIRQNNLLVGVNPPDISPEDPIILFGDCAIETTRDYAFRKITKKTLIRKKDKKVTNKHILELPGCPPNLWDCFYQIKDFFGKGDMPNLNYFISLYKKTGFLNSRKELKNWEEIE